MSGRAYLDADQIGAMATGMRALAQCAVQWKWTAMQLANLARICFIWEDTGRFPCTMPERIEDELSRLRAEVERMRPVVEAAEAIVNEFRPYDGPRDGHPRPDLGPLARAVYAREATT